MQVVVVNPKHPRSTNPLRLKLEQISPLKVNKISPLVVNVINRFQLLVELCQKPFQVPAWFDFISFPSQLIILATANISFLCKGNLVYKSRDIVFQASSPFF